ncbi:hypothetical protein HUJ04_004771 [Dendroctonus ponderosae]
MEASNLEATVTEVVCTVTPKLTAFWEDNPKGWFEAIEAEFRLANIEQSLTKLDYVTSILTSNQTFPILDIITEPPAIEPYEKAKDRLIKEFENSYNSQYIRILDHVTLGDREPTEMLEEIKKLVPLLNETTMRKIFVSKLPSRAKEFASCLTKLSLDELAEVADLFQTNFNEQREQRREFDLLIAVIRALNNLVTEVRSSRECFEEYIYGQGSEEQSSSESSDERICYYHRKFGDNAFKCKGRCNYNA